MTYLSHFYFSATEAIRRVIQTILLATTLILAKLGEFTLTAKRSFISAW